MPVLFPLSLGCGAIGLLMFALGILRLAWIQPRHGWHGGSLVLAGALFLCLGLLGHGQYLASHKGRRDYCFSSMGKGIATGLEMYAQDNDGQLPTSLLQLTPIYLKSIPKCPAAGRDTYSESYVVLQTADGPGYRFSCHGFYHRAAGIEPPNMPTYHSGTGIYSGDWALLRRYEKE